MCPRSPMSLDRSLQVAEPSLALARVQRETPWLVSTDRGGQARWKPDTLRTCRSSLLPRFSLLASLLFSDPFPPKGGIGIAASSKLPLSWLWVLPLQLIWKFPGRGSDGQARGHMPFPEPITLVERQDMMIAAPTTGQDLPLDRKVWRGAASMTRVKGIPQDSLGGAWWCGGTEGLAATSVPTRKSRVLLTGCVSPARHR